VKKNAGIARLLVHAIRTTVLTPKPRTKRRAKSYKKILDKIAAELESSPPNLDEDAYPETIYLSVIQAMLP